MEFDGVTKSVNTLSTSSSLSTNTISTSKSNSSPSVQSTTTSISNTINNQQQSNSNTSVGQQHLSVEISKQDDSNNVSVASAISEGQKSLSCAPSASSSPILSPPGKLYGRNANGTLVATLRPNNEAEVQLYRLLQKASLLMYFDTMLEMGGDDIQQLYEAGEEEFLEIMALVGMASKPLHVRRLQKVLHEWANNPAAFQSAIVSQSPGLTDTPPKPIFHPIHESSSSRCHKVLLQNVPSFSPMPLFSASQAPILPQTNVATSQLSSNLFNYQQSSSTTPHQVTSSSPQLTPVLTDAQVTRITLGAEKIARQLPQREPRAHTSKKRTSRELDQVIAMGENDPRRMDEIRKYSAIYGRFDCKRRPEKPLTLHEVCVNEAAAQLCRVMPALLTRRDELFPLARQIVKDAGFGHSASITRYGGLLSNINVPTKAHKNMAFTDCESTNVSVPEKRQRLSSTESLSMKESNVDDVEPNDSRYNLFSMYQKFARYSTGFSDIERFAKSDLDDAESQTSFCSSNSPLTSICVENDCESTNTRGFQEATHISTLQSHNQSAVYRKCLHSPKHLKETTLSGVQVISAAGEQIIAVTNPALILSPKLSNKFCSKNDGKSLQML